MTNIDDKRNSRLFVGIPVDEEGRRGLRRVMKILKRKHWPVRWEEEEKWHLTIAFLGSVGDVAKVREAIRSFDVDGLVDTPIKLRFKGLETFPRQKMRVKYKERMHGRSMRRLKMRQKATVALPKVIWARMGGEVRMVARIVKELREDLGRRGIWFDRKPFVPHVSLGRVRADAGREERVEMGKVLGKLYDLDVAQTWRASEIALYESVLCSDGSRYTKVASKNLGGGQMDDREN